MARNTGVAGSVSGGAASSGGVTMAPRKRCVMKHRWLVAGLICSSPFLMGGNCNRGDDPPTNGSIQLFYDVDVTDAPALGLGDLASLEITTSEVTAKLDSPGFTGDEFVLDATPGTATIPARTQLITGQHYEVPPGFITQLRFYPTLVRFHFNGGGTADIRVPSADQTGWKVVVDETQFPNGYEVKSRQVTGIRLFMNLGELFHFNKAQGWMARPTIRSDLYNIIDNAGYDPDRLVVVFDPATPQGTIDRIINSGNFTIDFRYPKPPPQLYTVHLPPNMSLRDAHAYFRGFSEVLAAAPSAKVFERLTPSEGTPAALSVLGADTGWGALQTATGSVGSPNVVVAEISTGGLNVEHTDLWPNIWLNQNEILAVCGTLAQCDVDLDGFVTLKDFNNPAFPAASKPPDNGDGRITCADLLAPGSQYLNGVDDGGNGFVDDLCGWNFSTNSNAVQIPPGCNQPSCDPDHDTACTGIMGAIGNNEPSGRSVGTCWNCRVMAVVGTASAPSGTGTAMGATAQVISAFAYARDNGAHVANFSAGLDLIPSNGDLCPSRGISVDKAAYSTVISEMNAVVTAALSDLSVATPLYTLAGGECNPGVDDGDPNYYDWPPEAFFSGANTKQISITVAATANTAGANGGLAGYCNFGGPFEIAASGNWSGMINGYSSTNTYNQQGTSFAAPTVGGIAACIAAGNLATYATPNGAALKTDLLNNNTVVDSSGLAQIPGSRRATMLNLP